MKGHGLFNFVIICNQSTCIDTKYETQASTTAETFPTHWHTEIRHHVKIGLLSRTKTVNQFAFIIIDRFNKCIWSIPATSKASTKIVHINSHNLVVLHCCSDIVHFNNGQQLISKILSSLCT